MKVDVAIIGGGLSGAMAALHAASKGRRVVVIRKAWGGTALFGGGFLSHGHTNVSDLDDAFSLLKQVLPFRFKGAFRQPRSFITQYGSERLADITLETQFCSLDDIKKPILALGIESIMPMAATPSDKVVTGNVPWHHAEFNLLPALIAKRLDDPKEVSAFAKQIKLKTKSHEFSAILLPPILGLRQFENSRKSLEQHLGTPVYEMLGSSVPGMRLQLGLEQAMKEKGVIMVQGKVGQIHVTDRRVMAVGVKGANHTDEIHASQFVLASGKFFSGGIRKEKTFRETVFNLPLFMDDVAVRDLDTSHFINSNCLSEQALYRLGVMVNNTLQPMGENQKPIYENVRACGTIIGGDHFLKERFAFGLRSGFRAGLLAGELSA